MTPLHMRDTADALDKFRDAVLFPLLLNDCDRTIRAASDDLEERLCRLAELIEDEAERYAPTPCITIAKLNAGKTAPVVLP